MNNRDLDLLEKELEAMQPAQPPQEFAERLSKAITNADVPTPTHNLNLTPNLPRFWSNSAVVQDLLARLRFHLRWLVPASVAVIASLIVLRSDLLGVRRITPVTVATPTPAMKADDVKIDSTLMSSFDAVASLPDGEPVRFRCEEWMDEMRLKDSSRGLVYSQRVPRVTVVPVCFETY